MRESIIFFSETLATIGPRYYILRGDMLGYYINDLVQRLDTRREEDGWQVRQSTT
jgi:hypothetical protein